MPLAFMRHRASWRVSCGSLASAAEQMAQGSPRALWLTASTCASTPADYDRALLEENGELRLYVVYSNGTGNLPPRMTLDRERIAKIADWEVDAVAASLSPTRPTVRDWTSMSLKNRYSGI